MKRPLFLPLLGLMMGILSSRHLNLSDFYLGIAFAFVFLILGLSIIRQWQTAFKIFLPFLFAIPALWLTQNSIHHIENHSNLLQFAGSEKLRWLGKVLEPCQQSEKSGKLILELWEIEESDKIYPVQGRLLLTIPGEEACQFSQGDVLKVLGRLKAPDSYRNRDAFDYAFYLKSQGITATGFVESKDFVVKLDSQASSLQAFFEGLRTQSLLALNAVEDSDSKNILKALLLGGSQKLSEPLSELFRKSGTSHLMVVSGLHLAMVMGVLYGLFRFLFSLYPPLLLKIRVKIWSYWAALPCVVFYSKLVGFSPSVLRALGALLLLGILLLFRRKQDPLSLLFLIAFGLLFVWPLLLFDLSFQLSFLSVFAILFFYLPLQRGLQKKYPNLFQKGYLKIVIEIILMSVIVQMVLLPLLINRFHQINWVTVPANLFLVPYFSFVLMPLGLCALLFSWIKIDLGIFLFKICAYLLKPALGFLKILVSPEWVITWLPGLNAFQIVLYVGTLLCLLLRLQRKIKIFVLLLLIFFNVFAWFYPRWKDANNPDLRISFLDVGQGDSILIEFPHGKKMLVDAGGLSASSFDIGERVLLPTLLGRGVTHLDYMVLTHPHPDHFGGMKSLLKVYRPQEFWWNGEKLSYPDFQDLLKELEKNRIPLHSKNASSLAENINGVEINFLNPFSDSFFSDKADAATLNNHSLVFTLKDRGFTALFSGDIQKEAELKIVESKGLEAVTLLKVPHHGSNTSSTKLFLDNIRPRHAVIQLGRNNRFGFPKPEVLEAYQQIETAVYRTDQSGEIQFIWDGKQLSVMCFQGCPNLL